jgi:hypothetical protein
MQLDACMGRREISLLLTPYTTINPKWITALKPLEENLEEHLQNLRQGGGL